MLDSRMVYTVATGDAPTIWTTRNATSWSRPAASWALRAGMRVLDIGYGWGSFAKYAVGNYGAEVVGVSESDIVLLAGFGE